MKKNVEGGRKGGEKKKEDRRLLLHLLGEEKTSIRRTRSTYYRGNSFPKGKGISFAIREKVFLSLSKKGEKKTGKEFAQTYKPKRVVTGGEKEGIFST